MALNWRRKEYFKLLIGDADEAHGALELLVDDLHKDKPRTVATFLEHCGSEDFLWGLISMLRHNSPRVAGNSAYILGTLAEHHVGQTRVLALIYGQHEHSILVDLCNMLEYDDSESVMNAAGTLGTLAETAEGRAWMLSEQCMDTMIHRVMALLTSESMWTASNAALVLARLSISEEGCHHLLHHQQSHQLLTRLIQSLGVDEAGTGMNAAFAVGRICDTEEGREKLIKHQDITKMISVLTDMLSSKDPGCSKNACFAISCLAGNEEGHALLLNHLRCDIMLRRLAEQLHSTDQETSWFAAMTLRTLASKKKGCLVLRDHVVIVPALQEINGASGISNDLQDEVVLTLELLKKLDKPNPPVLEVKGPRELMVTWDITTLESGLDIIYMLYLDNTVLYKGAETSFLATNLKPNTLYNLQLQLKTEGDESQLSDPLEVTMDQCAPDAPEDLRILAVSTSQIRIGWSPPAAVNGGLKGYIVYNGKQQIESTTELCSILSSLAPSTKYDIYVCAFNHKGKGHKACISAATSELGKHAPGKPILNVRGRNEIHLTWSPPESPIGRLHKFEISINGKVVYSGTELCFTARRLVPNTDYTFKVIAVTSEGRCESEPARKKTPKDEYNVQSTAPIFFSHPHKITDQDTASKQIKLPQSKGNRIKTPLLHKQRHLTSSPCELTESRPSTGISSSESKSSSDEYRSIHNGNNNVENTAINNMTSGESKNLQHGVLSSTHPNKSATVYQNDDSDSNDSENSEEDDHILNRLKVVIHSKGDTKDSRNHFPPLENHTLTQNSGEPRAKTEVSKTQKHTELNQNQTPVQNSGERRTKTEKEKTRKHAELIERKYNENKQIRKHLSDQGTKPHNKHRKDYYTSGRSTTTGLRSLTKGTISDNFDNSDSLQKGSALGMDETEQMCGRDRNPRNHIDDVQKIPVACVKDGSADSSHYRERQNASINRKYTEVRQRQFTDTDLQSRKQDRKNRAFKGSVQVKKTSRLQSLNSAQESGLQAGFNRRGSNNTAKFIPAMTSSYRSESNSSDKISEDVDNTGFVLSSNGRVVYSEGESPNLRSKDKHFSIEERNKQQMVVDEGKYMSNALFKGKEPITKRTPNLFPWEREGAFFSESYERYSEADNISKNIANLQKTYSKPVNWNSMIDPLHDKHSCSDRSAFYQRAQTFMSSHRPLLKKTLEKLPPHGPLFTQTSNAGNVELPQQPNMSNNRYQFIPMQFRTQPLHMPGPPLHPGNPNANLYDKGAYVRKLEAMSYLSTQKKQSASALTSCRQPAMRYSHRESPSIQVESPKSRSASGLLTDAAH
ncbi:uncharacterized protein [Antedon mediterranea]|uniref:uncharacterized protein isoform X2 n=1 Tax=Antedon mediterranea TaxID=105859 RepID=UPI003AF8C9B7